MKNTKRILSILLLAALCLALTGCGTKAASNFARYFGYMADVVETSVSSSRAIREAKNAEPVVDENTLPAPANFTVDEAGNYSFDAVDGADYYMLYVYADAVTVDATAKSSKIANDGSASYSGSVSGFSNLSYGDWYVGVVAYPDYSVSEMKASAPAKAEYLISGAVELGEPKFGSMWSVAANTLEITVSGMNFSGTAYPERMELTLTNTADSADVVTLEAESVGSSATLSTDACTAGASYAIHADFFWDETLVTNPTASAEGGVAQTSATDNLIDEDYAYTGSIFSSCDFPHIQRDFDPVAGGCAGVWVNTGSAGGASMGMGSGEASGEADGEETDRNAYFEATPIAAANGAKYSYDVVVSSPSGSVGLGARITSGTVAAGYGTLDIFDDGTFRMELEYQYIRMDRISSMVSYMPGAECYGTYTVNPDGTLNLSYDHANAALTDFAVVTELTGKAAEAASATTTDTAASGEASGEAVDTASAEPTASGEVKA